MNYSISNYPSIFAKSSVIPSSSSSSCSIRVPCHSFRNLPLSDFVHFRHSPSALLTRTFHSQSCFHFLVMLSIFFYECNCSCNYSLLTFLRRFCPFHLCFVCPRFCFPGSFSTPFPLFPFSFIDHQTLLRSFQREIICLFHCSCNCVIE